MEIDPKRILKALSPNKVIIPFIIGLGVAIYIFYTNYSFDELVVYFSKAKGKWIFISVLVLLIRDIGYVYRIRYLTDKKLTWTGSIYTILLWEFASTVTPSAVGGTAVATLILFKEGISFGKSLAYVMVTAVLDNLFFIIVAPIVVFFIQQQIFPNINALNIQLGTSFQVVFFVSYSLILIYTFLMVYGLFFKPRALKWLLIKITANRLLKKWKMAAYEQGNEILIASKELKGKDIAYWTKAALSTMLIWVARYLMLNCLIAAFTDIDAFSHILIFSRQVVMWIIMLISITPGAAGLAEITFVGFFKEFLGSFSSVVAVFWRLFTYYPYLLFGILILPRWINRVFFAKAKLLAKEKGETKGDKI